MILVISNIVHLSQLWFKPDTGRWFNKCANHCICRKQCSILHLSTDGVRFIYTQLNRGKWKHKQGSWKTKFIESETEEANDPRESDRKGICEPIIHAWPVHWKACRSMHRVGSTGEFAEFDHFGHVLTASRAQWQITEWTSEFASHPQPSIVALIDHIFCL